MNDRCVTSNAFKTKYAIILKNGNGSDKK